MVTGKTSMMHSNMVDPLPQPVFPQGMKPEDFGAAVERRRRAVDRCNCQSLSIDMQFTLDTIEAGQPQLYIVDRHPGSIWLTDLNGCVCQLIVNATNRPDLGGSNKHTLRLSLYNKHDIEPMLGQCWADVLDGGPTLSETFTQCGMMVGQRRRQCTNIIPTLRHVRDLSGSKDLLQ